jgi:hypothetical protein
LTEAHLERAKDRLRSKIRWWTYAEREDLLAAMGCPAIPPVRREHRNANDLEINTVDQWLDDHRRAVVMEANEMDWRLFSWALEQRA